VTGKKKRELLVVTEGARGRGSFAEFRPHLSPLPGRERKKSREKRRIKESTERVKKESRMGKRKN